MWDSSRCVGTHAAQNFMATDLLCVWISGRVNTRWEYAHRCENLRKIVYLESSPKLRQDRQAHRCLSRRSVESVHYSEPAQSPSPIIKNINSTTVANYPNHDSGVDCLKNTITPLFHIFYLSLKWGTYICHSLDTLRTSNRLILMNAFATERWLY